MCCMSTRLIGPHTINTLPPKTIDAFRDHGVVAQTIETDLAAAAGTSLRKSRPQA